MRGKNLVSHSGIPCHCNAFLAAVQRNLSVLLLASVSLWSCTVDAAGDSQLQLKTIQQNIAAKEKSVSQQKLQRSKLLDQLQAQEKEIATASQNLRKTRLSLSRLEQDISTLNQSITQLQKQQKQQETLLAQQLDAAFRQGKHRGMQTLLAGEESQRKERILAYFRYLNEARQKTITALQHTRDDVAAQKTERMQKQQQQKSLLDEQQTGQKRLELARAARKKTLTDLETTLKKNQADLAEMRQNERRLQEKIARAEREAKARAEREAQEAERVRQRQAQAKSEGSVYQPTESERSLMARTGGLGRPAGQALWPVRGQIIHRFGEALQGELRWKGLVINAPEGSEVKAIADGRVLMADWLQGYGLVVVVAHGKGDMSLYGYNQSALVSTGMQVRAGQPVALVGTSGGQGAPSLYFEIRRQGQAVNPLPWLGK